jgi:hypothetical protein
LNNSPKIPFNHQIQAALRTQLLTVMWQVNPEIGPDWIGSSREICFYWDDEQLQENELFEYLKQCLLAAVCIPETSKDDIIDGEGDLFIENNNLMINYTAQYSKPYAYTHAVKNGKVLLIENI